MHKLGILVIYNTGTVQRPSSPLNSASQPWQGRSNRMTRQFRIYFYLWALVKVRQRSMVMVQLSLRRHWNPSLMPLAPIPCKDYINYLLPTNMMSMDPLRHKSLLFLATFYPITGNALTILNLTSLWWTKIVFVVPYVGQNPKEPMRKKVAPLCKLGKYS